MIITNPKDETGVKQLYYRFSHMDTSKTYFGNSDEYIRSSTYTFITNDEPIPHAKFELIEKAIYEIMNEIK